jgi:alpha-glucosidase
MLEVYKALAKIRKDNSALHDGSMRFVYASNELIAYVRENKKQSVLVVVSRGEDPRATIPLDAVAGIRGAKQLFGEGKLKVIGKEVLLPNEPMSVNIWALEAPDSDTSAVIVLG